APSACTAAAQQRSTARIRQPASLRRDSGGGAAARPPTPCLPLSSSAAQSGGERGGSRARRMVREVAESCVDGVVMEMVAAYCGRFYAAKPELAARRIEAIGFQVGHQLSERYTMERPRFSDHLEAIKFICKDFWSELFKKQIDNLKTNHRGTFVLQDNRFRWLTRVSLDPSAESTDATDNDSAPLGDTAAQTTSMLLYFPCGLIRGALTNLGISCSVSADMSNLPACSFVVRIKT
ncbi:unnamed protein product, partial [Urochloa humidicola]